ncbi:MAG: acyl--CoA ligase [Sphingomonadales bacterium]|nr:acyl--CoA ligase [Sphingomonadales bacterium]
MATPDPPSTIPAMLAAVVASRAGHDAVVTRAERLTYADLDAATARMARALLAAGLGKGGRMALLANDGPLWITAFLAGLRIGALVTVLSTLATPRELAHMLRHSDVQLLVATRRFLGHDYAATLAAALPGLDRASPGRIALADAPYLRAIWLDDVTGVPWAGTHAALLDGADAIPPALLAAAEAQVNPADDAVIVYTSGSTALPKAVVHSQWNVTRHPPELARLFLVRPGNRMLPMLPAFWLGGMAMALQVLSQGATLVYPLSPDHEELLRTIRECRVNRLNGWGDGLVRLRAAATSQGIDVDAIVGLGPFRDAAGTPIPPHLQSNMLGMSETFAPHSAEPIDQPLPPDRPGASGRAVNGYERRVVDPETGAVLPPGATGELQLRGGALMSGFYKRRRTEVFTADGFYPTGDLVTIDADGWLTFVARRNDMIKTRAANVSRLEVETALLALPGVASAVVTGLPDADFGQVVAAAVVPAPASRWTEATLREELRKVLSSYKVPRRIVFVAEADIPRTATGKLRLHDLAALFDAGAR